LSGAFSSLWASSGPGCRCVVHASFLVSRWPAHREQRSSENKAPDPEGSAHLLLAEKRGAAPLSSATPALGSPGPRDVDALSPSPPPLPYKPDARPSPPVQTGRAPLPSRTNRTRISPCAPLQNGRASPHAPRTKRTRRRSPCPLAQGALTGQRVAALVRPVDHARHLLKVDELGVPGQTERAVSSESGARSWALQLQMPRLGRRRAGRVGCVGAEADPGRGARARARRCIRSRVPVRGRADRGCVDRTEPE
jgi:hypothetical protein